MNTTTDSFFKHLSYLAIGTVALLMIPLIAMQYTGEVDWSLSDFVIMGALIFGTGFFYLILTRKTENAVFKIAAGLALGSSFFLIWSNLAVGLIGSESNAINLSYFGVILIGVIGAVISRFKANGLMITLFSMAGAMVLIALIAFVLGAHNYPYSSVMEILGVTGFFVVPFVLSGLLFRNASGLDIKEDSDE